MPSAKHYDEEKPRLELLPSEAMEEIAKVLSYGAEKYSDDNWLQGMPWMKLIGSTLRHIFAWARREEVDPESQLLHLAHAACNLLFVITYIKLGIGTDNRREL